jgi:hypothetical protein
MQLLKQSTTATVIVGPVLDADGVAVTTAVLADFSIAKNGSVATLTGATVTHSTNGYYTIALTTGNVDSLGRLDIIVNNSAMSMSNHRYDVLPSDTYEELMTTGIADAVWDEVLTGATHNVAASAGRRLRQLASVIVHSGTAQGAGTGNNQIQLDTGASSTNGAYDPGLVFIETGTGAGQTRLILQYNGSTKVATVDRDWRVNPDNTSEFVILGDAGRESVNEGLAQAATTTTITLNTSASTSDDAYNGQLVFIRSGTGQDQIALVEDYVGSTKVATIRTRSANGEWAIVPDTTSAYVMIPNLTWTIAEMQAGLATTTQLTTVETKIDTIDDFVDTEISAIKAKTDQLSFTVANQVDANALTGGGGGGSIVVTPVVAQTPVRAVATTITTYKGDRSAITVGVFSGTSPVNLSTLGALEVCIQTKAGTDLQLIAAANITISGTDSNYFSFSPNATAVGTVGRFMWSLRVASSGSKQVIVYGAFVVEDAALAD